MEEFDSRYLEVMVNPEQVEAARALKPMYERPVFGRSVMLFEHVDREQVAALGDVRRPSIADLFVATMGTVSGRQMSEVGSQYPESRIQDGEAK
jgi:ABC-2 type transport system ATP-binding protein